MNSRNIDDTVGSGLTYKGDLIEWFSNNYLCVAMLIPKQLDRHDSTERHVACRTKCQGSGVMHPIMNLWQGTIKAKPHHSADAISQNMTVKGNFDRRYGVDYSLISATSRLGLDVLFTETFGQLMVWNTLVYASALFTCSEHRKIAYVYINRMLVLLSQ